jgi:hypothetical protein
MSPQLLGQWLLITLAMCARLLGSDADGCGFVRRVTLPRETCTSKYCRCSSCRSDVESSEKEVSTFTQEKPEGTYNSS